MPQLFNVAGPVRPTFDQTKATAEDFGAGVGKGLQVAAGALKEREDFLEQQEERKAGMDREKTIAGDRLWATTRLQELQRELPNGGEGAAEQLKLEVGERFTSQKDAMRTKTAGEDYDLQYTQLMSQVMFKAVVIDAAASSKGVAITVGGTLDDNRNTVAADPLEAQNVIEQNTRLINDSMLSTAQKEKWLRKETEKVWAAAADGLTDPVKVANSMMAEAVVEELKKKKWRDKLSPKDYTSKLAKARKLQADHQGKEWAATRDDINNRIPEISLGASNVTMEPSEANGVSNDPKLVAEYKRKINVANEEGVWNRLVSASNDSKLEELEDIAKKAVATEGGDFKSEIKQLQIVKTEQGARITERNEADKTTVENIEESVDNQDFSAARKNVDNINDERTKKRVSRLIDRQEDSINKDKIVAIAENIGSGVANAKVDESLFDAIHNEALKRKLKDLVRKAKEISVILKTVKKGSKEEVDALSNHLVNVVNFEGGKEARDELAALLQARKIKNTQVEQDRVGYVTTHSEVVKNAINNHAALNTPESRQELTNILVSEQERLGIDPRNAYLLTHNMVEVIRHQKLGITDEAKKPQEVYALIQEQRMNAGEDWPRVMKQLTERGVFAGSELAAAGMQSEGHAQALLVASNIPKDIMNKNLGANFATIRSDVAGFVDTEMADLRPTLANAAGGEAAYATYRDAVVVYALKLISEGSGIKDAANTSAQEVIMKNYDIDGSVRVPVSSRTTAERVNIVGRLVTQQFLDYSKLVAPSPPPGVQQSVADAAYKKSIQKNGQWVTNGDESGVTLVDEHGNPVFMKEGGNRVELLWSEMGTAALSGVRRKFK